MRALVAVTWVGLVGALGQGAGAQQPASAPADVRFGPLPDTNTNFQPARYGSLEEWAKRRDWLRMQVRVAAGLWPEPEKCPLNAKVFGKIEGDGYTIEKVYFESYPGLYVTGNLYRHARPPQGAAATDAPGRSDRQDAGPTSRYPGVLCPHGHWKSGRLEQTEVGNIPARCIMLARMGCTVFAYDMVGYNDSARQFDHRKINTPELDLWGITSMHLQTWNSIRAIDFLQSLPEVDPERIGVTGASGGGTQTFMIAAVDDRVKVTCPVNMISHTMQGGCSCENAPCLRIDTNNMEIGALMAPRPMLMVSATGDWTKDTPKVEYPFIKSIYELYGKPDLVENAHIDAGHNYNQQSREAMYRFFAKHLLGWPEEKANAVKEHDIPAYKEADLLVWNESNLPERMLTFDELVNGLKKNADRKLRDLESDRKALVSLVCTGLEQAIASTPARMVKPRIVHCEQESAQGWSVCMKSLLRQDSPSKGFFTTFNRTGAASVVQELLYDSVWKAADSHRSPSEIGQGTLGPATLVARAFVTESYAKEEHLRTVIDMNRFDIDSDEAYLKELNIPHIRRIGGLRAIAAVACNGPIWFHNVGDHFDEAFVKAAGQANGVEVRVTKEKASDAEIAAWLTQRE